MVGLPPSGAFVAATFRGIDVLVCNTSQKWPLSRIETLIGLWLDGIVTSEIAERMRCTKNSIIGRAHRLGLPGRKSPIIRGFVHPPVTPKQIPEGVRTLPPLPSELAAGFPWPQMLVPTASAVPDMHAGDD